jgi:hypothetical protein
MQHAYNAMFQKWLPKGWLLYVANSLKSLLRLCREDGKVVLCFVAGAAAFLGKCGATDARNICSGILLSVIPPQPCCPIGLVTPMQSAAEAGILKTKV